MTFLRKLRFVEFHAQSIAQNKPAFKRFLHFPQTCYLFPWVLPDFWGRIPEKLRF